MRRWFNEVNRELGVRRNARRLAEGHSLRDESRRTRRRRRLWDCVRDRRWFRRRRWLRECGGGAEGAGDDDGFGVDGQGADGGEVGECGVDEWSVAGAAGEVERDGLGIGAVETQGGSGQLDRTGDVGGRRAT